MIEPDDIFVGRTLALGRGAPAALEIGVIPDREYGVSVVGIDGEKHVAPFTRPGRPLRRRCAGTLLRSRAISFLRDQYRESGRTRRETRGGPGSALRERLPWPLTRMHEPALSPLRASAYSTIGNWRRIPRASPLAKPRPSLLP